MSKIQENKKTDPILKGKEIRRWMGFMAEAADKGYVYEKGLQELKKLGADTDPGTKDELKAIIDKVQEKKKKAQEEHEKNAPKYDVHTIDTAPPLNTPVKIRDKIVVYEKTGNPFRIDEDAPSIHGSHLLGHEGEKGYRYYYREATDEEIGKYKEKQKQLQEKKINS